MRNDIQAAIDAVTAAQDRLVWDYAGKHEGIRAFETAITALREQLKRSEGCEWCHGYIMMDKNYCAECGRQLFWNAEHHE